MSKEFVIVIEADNKRAAAAYRKGLEDLDLVMPQLLAAAATRDEKRNEAHAKAMEEWHAQAPVLELDGCWLPSKRAAAEDSYRREVVLHNIRQPRNFAGREQSALESVRAELKRMCDIAEAAIGPYRMTEHQVAQMIGWEDGSRVERLKLQYA